METWEEKADRLLHDEFVREVDTPDQILQHLTVTYKKTNNPVHLIAAFCYHVFANEDGNGDVSLPQWMTKPLAEGFAYYLDSFAKGQPVSLEQSLGITPEIQHDTKIFTTIDEMVEHVNIIRWLFGLKLGDAVHATFQKYKHLVGKDIDLKQKGITQDEPSFKQHYQRKHADNFKAWVENRDPAQRTEHHKQQILSQVSRELATFIKHRDKHKTL